MEKEKWIDRLELLPHPEGGYYREIFRAETTVGVKRGNQTAARSTLTSIYFLLGENDRSVFHRLQSDEIWYYHAGSGATIFTIDPSGKLSEHRIGPDLSGGESLQVVIPDGCWFGAKVNPGGSFILVSCAVAPGFDFYDFEIGEKTKLLQEFPQHASIINLLS